MTTIELESAEDRGEPARTGGSDEVVVPAPCAVTLYVGGPDTLPTDDTTSVLCVGWNADGSPVVVQSDGGIGLLSDGLLVRDVTW